MSLLDVVELLPRGIPLDQIPLEHQENLRKLCEELLPLREACNFPWIVTNGYRTLEHHEEIYHVKNELRMKAGLMPVHIPMGSAHLFGNAVDIADPNKKLQHWLLDHLDMLEDQGIYCESFDACQFPSPWVHFQRIAPKSGRRFFEP